MKANTAYSSAGLALASLSGPIWIALEQLGLRSGANTIVFWLLVMLSAVLVGRVSSRASLFVFLTFASALSFAAIPVLRQMLNLPADFRGLRGFLILLSLGIVASLVTCGIGWAIGRRIAKSKLAT